jgi:PAS domain S-box-containing protein
VDVSERKQIELEQKKIATAVHQTDDLVIITDLSGSIEYINPTFEKTTGYSLGEAQGKNPSILKSGKHSDDFYQEMWKSILAGRVWRGRLENRRKGGSEYTAEVTTSPIRDQQGDLTNFVGVQRDISHEIALEKNLRQAQKLEAMGTLAGGIAHEINTPAQFVNSNLVFTIESFPDITEYIDGCV